jgi:hypothetical protein
VKVYDRNDIIQLLDSSDNAVRRGMIVLHKRNEIHPGNFLMASFIRQLNTKNYLSIEQLSIARKMLKSYADKLTDIANEPATKEIHGMIQKARGLRIYTARR